MLLQEYRPFKVNKTLAEQAIKKNKPLIVSGVLQRAEAKNQNGRVYPKNILERELKQDNIVILSSPIRAFTCPFALSAALSVRDVRGPINPIGPVSLF